MIRYDTRRKGYCEGGDVILMTVTASTTLVTLTTPYGTIEHYKFGAGLTTLQRL